MFDDIEPCGSGDNVARVGILRGVEILKYMKI